MRNVAASVLARLKNLAKAKGLVYNEVLVRYAIERVLKRLELSPYASKCILKGGSMFIIWNGVRLFGKTVWMSEACLLRTSFLRFVLF